MPVDSYRYLPRSFREGFEAFPIQETEPVRADLAVAITDAKIALMTSSGLYLENQEPFDLDTEIDNPLWGDPTYREIPRQTKQQEISAAHLHLNTRDYYVDFNVALPLDRFAELESEKRFGSLADTNYSFMGYQQDGTPDWRRDQGPELIGKLKEQGVHALILAPA
jgi:D-proline reductase (dithiol) PrdB